MGIIHPLKKRFSECLSETVGQISNAYFCALYLFCERNILQIIYKLQREEDAFAYIKIHMYVFAYFLKRQRTDQKFYMR